MDIETIIYKIEDRSIKSNNPVLNNHLMFYRDFLNLFINITNLEEDVFMHLILR